MTSVRPLLQIIFGLIFRMISWVRSLEDEVDDRVEYSSDIPTTTFIPRIVTRELNPEIANMILEYQEIEMEQERREREKQERKRQFKEWSRNNRQVFGMTG
jgi:hypothetical protein